MTHWWQSLSPVAQAGLGGVGTWLLTALGALPVLFLSRVPRRLMDGMMGGAAGVMVAAACWSLLVPAMALGGVWRTAAGLLAGAALIYLFDQLLPHLHPEFPDEARPEGPRVPWRRSALLLAAITLHNFPEGLAVGVAFGSDLPGPALALAIGIGLQNLPEGLAVALPLRRDGMSRWKALWYGQLSAIVEPVAAVIGAADRASPAVRHGTRRRRDALRGGGGADRRNGAERQHRRRHDRLHRGVRRDDGAGNLLG